MHILKVIGQDRHYICETWVAAQPTLKIAAKTLYPTVSKVEEVEPIILQGKQPPKTEENETATRRDPATCQILKRPNLSICQMDIKYQLSQELLC